MWVRFQRAKVGSGLWTDRLFKPGARHRRASAGPEVQPYQPLHPTSPSFDHTRLKLISEEELLLIQKFWNSARNPDDGGGVARIVTRQRGIVMSDLKEVNPTFATGEENQ